jgi:hypothetical protein
MTQSIDTLYRTYQSTNWLIEDESERSIPMTKGVLFNELSSLILSKSTKTNVDLLKILNQCVNKPNNFFDDYATHLSSCNSQDIAGSGSQRRDAQSQSRSRSRSQAINILFIVLNMIKKLSRQSNLKLTKFIWGHQGFRDLIKYCPILMNGQTAMTTSIFCNLTIADEFMTDIDSILECYEPMIADPTIHIDLIRYINRIFVLNNDYSFDDPRMMNRNNLSTMDFLVMCLGIFVKVMKSTNNVTNGHSEYVYECFWKMVNNAYFPLHTMYNSVTESLQYYQEQFKLNSSDRTVRMTVQRGTTMVKNLSICTGIVDSEYIDNKICDLIDNLISTRDYNVLARTISSFGHRTLKNIHVSKSKLSKMVLSILDNNVPLHIKFDTMRFVMSHGLKKEIFLLDNSTDIFIRYILSDVIKLKELDKIHLIDMMIELSDVQSIMLNPDIIELYMFLLPDFSEQYTNILNMFLDLQTDEQKNNALNDINNIAKSCPILISKMSILGRLGLSYISDMLNFIETILNTKNIIRDLSSQPRHQDLVNSENKDNFENVVKIFDEVKERHIESIQPVLLDLLHEMIDHHRVVLDGNAQRILEPFLSEQFLGINNNKILFLSDIASNCESDILDGIKCDLAINPYFINIGETKQGIHQLIDRKTLYNMYRTKVNPYTGEPINKKTIDEFNESIEIQKARQDVIDKINKL